MESSMLTKQPLNPWCNISSHPFNKILSVANFHDNTLLPEHQVEEAFKKSDTAQKLGYLKSICDAAAERRNVNVQVKKLEVKQQCHDLKQVEALQSKLSLVQTLAKDLEVAIKNQKFLKSKLKEPHQGEQLSLEAKYHTSAFRMFQNIATSLSNMQNQLELIKWHRDHEVNQRRLFDFLRDLSTQVKLLHLEWQQLFSNPSDEETNNQSDV